jgi:hypothetical protein
MTMDGPASGDPVALEVAFGGARMVDNGPIRHSTPFSNFPMSTRRSVANGMGLILPF